MKRRQVMQRTLTGLALGALLAGAGCTATSDSKGGKSEGVLPGVNALVFVKRSFTDADGKQVVSSGMGQVFDYDRYVPGKTSGVYVLTPPGPNGELRNLTEGFEGVDINGLDLSFDAKKVVFSMRTADDNRYHIYLANVDGSGKVKQLTFHDADDVQPVFLAGDRIVFVTNQPYTEHGTRADEYNHARAVTQLATISVGGGDSDRRLCSQNLSHSTSPFALANGLVGYSRWEHLGPTNDLKLFTMRPDCTQMRALAGQHDKPFNSLVQVREIGQGQFLGIATNRDGTIQSGALTRVTVPYKSSGDPDTIGQFDEQHARFENLTLSVPTDDSEPPTGVGRYRAPQIMPKSSKILVSWANGDVNDRNELAGNAPNFGLYLYDPAKGKRELVYDDTGMWDLYALPVSPRDEPPLLPALNDGAYDADSPATIGSIDVRQTSLKETVTGAEFDGQTLAKALRQAQRVRVVEGFSSEIGSVGQFGLTMHEGAAILGEPRVHSDGSWLAEIPPYTPVHLQPIDRFDLAIRNQLLWIQGMPGESRLCGGCHESRTGQVESLTTQAQSAGPEDLVKPVAQRLEYPWFNASTGSNVQDVFDARCVSCHSGGDGDPFKGQTYTVHVTVDEGPMKGEKLDFTIPVLDLSSRSITAYYERETVTYPASYVTLLFPSAMMGEIRVEGAPQEWVIPGSARTSRLIAKINVNAVAYEGSPPALVEKDVWAFPTKPHPEDVGGSMTREERVTLIRAVDLGGQYYSRRNVEGAGQMNYKP
jgi:hypothetical protein